jgi:hemoglobin
MIAIDFDTILKVITSFYAKATVDVMIGYHFRSIEDFDTHLPKIASFWQLQLTGTITNKDHLPFDLIKVHLPLKVKSGEIDRWVKIFEQNLEEFDLEAEVKNLWIKKTHLFKDKLKSGLTP